MTMTSGLTTIPRWTLEPVDGIAECEAEIGHELLAALRAMAEERALSFSAVLLAGHAKVLAALSGERDVVTGYVPTPAQPAVACRLRVPSGPWHTLLAEADRVESEVRSSGPVLVGGSFETVFDPTGAGEHSSETELWVAVEASCDRPRIRLLYRADVIDAACAARIAGYHINALALMAADPEVDHDRQSLLSSEERRFQIEGLAGPSRPLPDARIHELFEQRVAAAPDAVAAVLGDRRWTYCELNVRANRLARSLLGRGLRPEGVVAVVTERNLDWLAAVLAVFKAGGVYMPIEPHFPADRIATMLRRAGCRLVVTEPGSSATLDRALESLPAVRKLLVTEGYHEAGAEEGNLGIGVAPDQLAYIYFTSGSTGEPKGAMCEHAGLLNHLLAKIEDLGITAGDVVAQTAPQCFDISLWQLVSALLVGGRTLLVEQDVVLDVRRFVETIARARAGVVQVVPSYLEAVLSCLEQHPRDLPDLRCVSATGEALKQELVQRWFAAQPGIKLVNAYGLTETSDDTNHEIMDEAPAGERVPLGRPIRNVSVYVVDEHLAPVPLGAPGLIVFSGICVGRGYVNDPVRTADAYLTDPHRPGQRLYRGGDYGRWRPDGKLEFLGRRDSQVKIRGFRIEIGEIENTLVGAPGVSDAAVVVTERADESRHLTAFYSGSRPIEPDVLAGRLRASLPAYMIPSAFHWREDLPLTANGKIDRKTLTGLAADLDLVEQGHEAPATPAERRLAATWAAVLGISPDQIGRWDHFFDLGGTSLSAVKLVVLLDRVLSLEDVTSRPVLADMAVATDLVKSR